MLVMSTGETSAAGDTGFRLASMLLMAVVRDVIASSAFVPSGLPCQFS